MFLTKAILVVALFLSVGIPIHESIHILIAHACHVPVLSVKWMGLNAHVEVTASNLDAEYFLFNQFYDVFDVFLWIAGYILWIMPELKMNRKSLGQLPC